MIDLFGNTIPDPGTKIKPFEKGNPCITAFGSGPQDKKCKSCFFCYEKQFSSTYYKCEFRADTNGPATDHKANWPACRKYREKMRTLAVCQPFGSLIAYHNKIETRLVKTGRKPSFPLGMYLLYTTKKAYNEETVLRISGSTQLIRMANILKDDESIDMNGYAICVGELKAVRLMTPADEDPTFVQYRHTVEKKMPDGSIMQCKIWCLEFDIKPIVPFKFIYGTQGVQFLERELYERIELK